MSPMNPDTSNYTARFNMVMLPEERAMLQALAKSTGLKESDVLRQMVRREYAKLGKKKPSESLAKSKSPTTREPTKARKK